MFFFNKNLEIIDYDFECYIECGSRIDLTFAIDYTISNGNLLKGEPSLHSLDHNYQNIYTEIMSAISSKLQAFQTHEAINTVLGFGARPVGSRASGVGSWNQRGSQGTVSAPVLHCIDLQNVSPGVHGALQTYVSSLNNFEFAGPTHYNEVINFMNQKSFNHNMFYKVCVIITDGDPQDLQQTIDMLVISSFKPISVIVVTVCHPILDKVDHRHL